MNIYLLGTGSAVATSERDNSSIFFKSNDFNILIDCSGSTVHKISKLGLDFKDIQNVLITHFHPDHVYGLPSLIHSLAPYDKFPVIYAPDNLINNIYELMKVFGFENNVTILSVKKLIQQYNFIDIFPTRHTEDSIGVILDYEGKKTVYTSDTGPINNLHHKISGCNYLIHDCYAPVRFKNEIKVLDISHTSAMSLGKIARDINSETLIPIHFSGEHSFSCEEITDEIKKYFSGKILIPEDLEKIPV